MNIKKLLLFPFRILVMLFGLPSFILNKHGRKFAEQHVKLKLKLVNRPNTEAITLVPLLDNVVGVYLDREKWNVVEFPVFPLFYLYKKEVEQE